MAKFTIKQAEDQFQFASEKASDIARQLAFALAWIFRVQTDTTLAVPPLLGTATAYATLGLSLDLAQYVYGVIAFPLALHRNDVSKEDSTVTVKASGAVSSWFFYGKITVITIAYALVLAFFVRTAF